MTVTQKPTPTTVRKLQRIDDLWRKNVSIAEISRRLEMSYASVHYLVNAHLIPKKALPELSEETKVEMAQIKIRFGLTNKEIAQEMNLPLLSVRKFFGGLAK